MQPAITVATAADAAAVIALWQACGLTRPWNDPAADFVLALATPTATILLARGADDGTADCAALLGTVMVGFDGHRGWVYYLSVAPSSRGLGTGRRLMAAAEDWLRAAGSPKIQLMVRGDNSGAIAFYQSLGYATQDVVTMGRRLDDPNG